MSEEQQTEQTQVAKIPKTQFSDEDWALVGVPSENALKALKAFCMGLVGTPFLPAALIKGQDADKQAATLLAVCLTGRELKFSPMQSLRSFWLSPDGRLGLYADSMMSIILRSGARLDWEKLDREGAVLVTTRDHNTYRSEFLKADAELAGLWNKNTWAKYPRAMFKARVVGDTFRTLFSDLGGSEMYTREEIEDMSDDDDRQRSAYVSARESAEREADKVAEADPGLKLVKKPEVSAKTETKVPSAETKQPAPETVPAKTAVVDVKAETVRTEPSAQELRNEAFLKRQANQNASEHGITDEDLPKLDEGAAVSPEVRAQSDFRTRIGAFMQQYGGTMQTWVAYATSFLGDPVKLRDIALLNDTMDKLEAAFSQYPAAVKNYIEDPKAFAKNVITALSMAAETTAKPSGPVAVPDKAPATRKPRETRQRAEPPPPPPPPPVEDDQPSVNPLDKVLPKEWSAVTCDLALDAMRARALTEERFISTMNAFSILSLKDEDALAFFEMYYHAPDSVLLVKRAAEKNRSMSSVLELLEKEFLKKSLGHDTPTAEAIKAVQNTISEVISL